MCWEPTQEQKYQRLLKMKSIGGAATRSALTSPADSTLKEGFQRAVNEPR